MLRCSRGNCRAIPVASCFAQPKGWQFTTKHQTGLLRHFSLHAKFASSTSQLLDIADKVTRTEAGTFACACGFHGTVGKVAKHRCQAVTRILHRVSKRANRKHGIRPAKRTYRSAASFAAALPQPSVTILVPSPESIGSYQNLMMTCAEVQKQLATPFLRLLCPASMAGKAPALNRHPRSLRVGDFIHRRRSGTYWCVKKLHLKTRMQVLELKPIECKDHDGTCWRVARRQGQPVCISATRTKLLQGGPLLHPRVATKSCSLAKRCYAKEEDVKTNEHDILSCVQIFSKTSGPLRNNTTKSANLFSKMLPRCLWSMRLPRMFAPKLPTLIQRPVKLSSVATWTVCESSPLKAFSWAEGENILATRTNQNGHFHWQLRSQHRRSRVTCSKRCWWTIVSGHELGVSGSKQRTGVAYKEICGAQPPIASAGLCGTAKMCVTCRSKRKQLCTTAFCRPEFPTIRSFIPTFFSMSDEILLGKEPCASLPSSLPPFLPSLPLVAFH